ncbi:MAG: Ldh family oxidoreductase [Firmicutes bacterium]|nr:Ldh family oxidoreductase [Bacillota bacterium]NSW92143.1 Ldh family oxidoreductase [Bacillota bacterium]
MDGAKLYKAEILKGFCTNILTGAGVKGEDAEIIAESLISAELRGVKSHGIVRLPTYIERLEREILSLNAHMEFERKGGAAALLDADNGFGQVAGHKAMNAAVDIAKTHGVGLVGVRNSNHFGIASYYSMLALKSDMIGIVLTHSSPAIAPYGTITPLLGTNPLSIAVPAQHGRPIVLDMSMSVVARGKIRYAALKGEEIPEGWGLNYNGYPTTDPNEVLKGGSLVPIGGVKGSGLALMIDILCGVLTNSCLTGEVKNITDMSGPSKTGHMFCAVNISSFVDANAFKSNIDQVISTIKSLGAIGNNSIYLPGEIEYELEEKRKREGIPVECKVVKSLNDLANRYGSPELQS